MIDLHLDIFGINLKLYVRFPKLKRKKKVNAEKSISNEEKPINESLNFYDEIENELDAPQTPINVLSDIENQALAFERELANAQIYDIPNASDIAPNHKISDDVEVITERFEKELEDLYEGRR